MDKQKILKFQIISALFISILGTLLHFTFEWSKQNLIVGAFSAVNESTWEHLKLLFFPSIFTIIIGYFYIGKNNSNFVCAKTVGVIVSIIFTIIFFYTSTGILGFNLSVLNIATFYIAVILGEYVAYKLAISNFNCNKKLAIIILTILTLSFILFTYFTPQIGLFQDPLARKYGII